VNQDIIRKLQKLQAMVDGGTTHEAANARRIYDTLINKYDIDESQLSEKKHREYTPKAKLRAYAVHAASFLGLSIYTYKQMRKSPLLIDSTGNEYNLFIDIVRYIEAVYNAIYKSKIKEAKKSVESYMYGFIMATYPTKDKPAECPTCKAEMKYSDGDRRYYCSSCGFVGKKLRKRELNYSDAMEGQRDSGRLLAVEA
jgi:hypothetical protein